MCSEPGRECCVSGKILWGVDTARYSHKEEESSKLKCLWERVFYPLCSLAVYPLCCLALFCPHQELHNTAQAASQATATQAYITLHTDTRSWPDSLAWCENTRPHTLDDPGPMLRPQTSLLAIYDYIRADG